jgi:hypothetical protein
MSKPFFIELESLVLVRSDQIATITIEREPVLPPEYVVRIAVGNQIITATKTLLPFATANEYAMRLAAYAVGSGHAADGLIQAIRPDPSLADA